MFKPQSAFFEPYGSAGIAVLERTLADIAAAGALSLLDVKRGDIGSTMDAYAAAYLADGAPLAADAITVSPYLGFGSLAGAIDAGAPARPRRLRARPDQQPGGAAVPARASRRRPYRRPGGGRRGGAGTTRRPSRARSGVVVGATIGRTGVDFSGLNGSILAPGLGAQGGDADGPGRGVRPAALHWCCRRPAGR